MLPKITKCLVGNAGGSCKLCASFFFFYGSDECTNLFLSSEQFSKYLDLAMTKLPTLPSLSASKFIDQWISWNVETWIAGFQGTKAVKSLVGKQYDMSAFYVSNLTTLRWKKWSIEMEARQFIHSFVVASLTFLSYFKDSRWEASSNIFPETTMANPQLYIW